MAGDARLGIWPDVADQRRGGYGSRGSVDGDDSLMMLGMRPDTAAVGVCPEMTAQGCWEYSRTWQTGGAADTGC